MFWTGASSVILLAAIAAGFWLGRRLNVVARQHNELVASTDRLKREIAVAERTLGQLQAEIQQARSKAIERPRNALAEIENLADSSALADANSLAKLAAQLPSQTSAFAVDIFEQDVKALSVARLCDQGLLPAEISSRLSLPIGEVEFLLSLRPASQA